MAYLAQALDARYAAAGLRDESGSLTAFHTAGLPPERARRIGALPSGRGLLGHVLRSETPIRLADLTRHPSFTGFPPGHPQMKALLGVPLLDRGRPFGQIYVCDKTSGAPFDADDEDLAACFAEMLALTLSSSRAAESIRRSEARHRSIVENISDVVSIVEPDGTIAYESPAIEPITGWRPEALVSRSILELVHPEDADLVGRSVRAIAARGGVVRGGYRFRRNDGSYCAVESIATRLDDDGHARVLVTSRDVTERERLTAELQRAREAAERASRAKSEFLANVSHELRTPLNAVIGMAGLLEETSLDAGQRELLATIRSSGDMLLGLVSDLLDLAKIEHGVIDLEPHTFSPRRCVEEAIELLAPAAAAKGLELVCDAGPEVPEGALADASRLRQVLVNLIANAVKFTERGEVVVRVDARRTPAGGLELAFAVRDSGIGIAAASQEEIFEPFRQADGSATRRHGGAGLGLALCRRLVHALGGQIGVESAPGAGSTFRFSIQARPAPDASRELSPLPPGDGTVLVAVRCERLGDALARLASSWGLRVERGPPDPSALAARAASKSLTAVILDPSSEGAAAAIAALSARSVPLILLRPLVRSHSAEQEIGDTEVRGAHILALSKPVRSSALREALEKALAPEGPRPGTSRRSSRARERARARSLRVLVAEDNRINQRVTRRMLERLGHRVDVAADGHEAVEAVARSRYDVILMDIQMPRMSGLEATRAIREGLARDLQPAVIALTANDTTDDRDRCRAAGMDGFLAKPVDPRVLERALRRYGGGGSDGRRPPRRATAPSADGSRARTAPRQTPDRPAREATSGRSENAARR